MIKFFSEDKFYDDIEIGTEFSVKRQLLSEDIETFATLVGDENPRHLSSDPSSESEHIMSHGMLVASISASLLGTHCPINNNLLVSISFNFRKPVFSNDTLFLRGKVMGKVDFLKILKITIEIFVKDVLVADGKANIKVMQ